MKFATFQKNGVEGLAIVNARGILRGRMVGDPAYPGDLDALIRKDGIAAAGEALTAAPEIGPAGLAYLPPFRTPGRILCVGQNYHDHRKEMGATARPEHPTIFARFPACLIGHETPIIRPKASIQLYFEGEMVAVIGRRGRHIAKDDALGYVAGYSAFNDATLRDVQRRTSQWTLGKNFDATGAFGPCFVTADVLPPGGAGLRLETRLNGEVMQSGSTADLIFDVATLVSLLSEAMTLEPGDLIVTGTPGGVGAARHPPVWMAPGDVCDVEIEGIGLLQNPIVAEA